MRRGKCFLVMNTGYSLAAVCVVGVAPGGHVHLADTSLAGVNLPLADPAGPVANVGSATFGQNAAHMAAITFQRPFRAAIHSSEAAGARPKTPLQ